MPFHFHRIGGDVRPAVTGPSLPMPDETSSELRYLEPGSVRFRREGTRFEVRLGDEPEWRDVTPVRLFPLTEPERWISLIGKDGREIGVLVETKGLVKDDLAGLREELHRRYLVPQIQRILSCRRRRDTVEWKVETNRGQLTFRTRHFREQVKEPSPSRLTLIDIEGNRFDIPSIEALDPDSRRRLAAQL